MLGLHNVYIFFVPIVGICLLMCAFVKVSVREARGTIATVDMLTCVGSASRLAKARVAARLHSLTAGRSPSNTHRRVVQSQQERERIGRKRKDACIIDPRTYASVQ